jgi:hypothetical protein
MADADELPGRHGPGSSASTNTSTKGNIMHTTGTRRSVALVASILVAFAASSCADETISMPSTTTDSTIAADAADAADAVVGDPDVTVAETGRLSDDEVAGLLWMREEEQLAHDVYVALGDQWGLQIFENIAASETNHIDAVAALLDRYGIDDPTIGNAVGEFTDPAIQALYDQMVADGSVSLVAALAVGVQIEELDIADLQTRAAATENVDINAVYANLERGSRNHLRAFTSQLDSRA